MKLFQILHFYLPMLKYMKLGFTPEETKQIADKVKESADEMLKAGLEKQKAEFETKQAAMQKELEDNKVKIADLIKNAARGKLFNVGGNFPNKVKMGSIFVDIDNQGSKINERVAKNPGLFNVLGKDTESYYNLKCYVAAKMLQVIDGKNDHPELKQLVKDYHAKANEMLEGTASQGADFVPAQYEKELILLNRDASHALQVCNSFFCSSNHIVWPKESGNLTAYIVGENAAYTASQVGSTNYEIYVKKLGVMTNYVSKELIQDAVFDFLSYLWEKMLYTMDQKVDYEVLFGVLASWTADIGLTTATITNEVLCSGGNGQAFSDLHANEFSEALTKLDSENRQNAQWIWGTTISHYMRTMQDDVGRYLMGDPSITPIMSPTLWGKKWTEWNKFDLASAAGTTFAVLGDFKQFDIANIVGGMQIEADPYTKFDYDMFRYKTGRRIGMNVRRPGAFCRVATKPS